MQIFVKIDITEKFITLEVEPTDRVKDVRAKIEEETGLDISNKDLVFAGKILEDDNTLQDYSLQKDSTIQLREKAEEKRELDVEITTDNVKGYDGQVTVYATVTDAKTHEPVSNLKCSLQFKCKNSPGTITLNGLITSAEGKIEATGFFNEVGDYALARVMIEETDTTKAVDKTVELYEIKDIPKETVNVKLINYTMQNGKVVSYEFGVFKDNKKITDDIKIFHYSDAYTLYKNGIIKIDVNEDNDSIIYRTFNCIDIMVGDTYYTADKKYQEILIPNFKTDSYIKYGQEYANAFGEDYMGIGSLMLRDKFNLVTPSGKKVLEFTNNDWDYHFAKLEVNLSEEETANLGSYYIENEYEEILNNSENITYILPSKIYLNKLVQVEPPYTFNINEYEEGDIITAKIPSKDGYEVSFTNADEVKQNGDEYSFVMNSTNVLVEYKKIGEEENENTENNVNDETEEETSNNEIVIETDIDADTDTDGNAITGKNPKTSDGVIGVGAMLIVAIISLGIVIIKKHQINKEN